MSSEHFSVDGTLIAAWASGVFDYGAAKVAILSLTKSLAQEFGPKGITVNPEGAEVSLQVVDQSNLHRAFTDGTRPRKRGRGGRCRERRRWSRNGVERFRKVLE